MHGGHLALGPMIETSVAEHGPFDLLVASSMTDLAALLGHCRHALGRAPVVYYAHENQLTYPPAPGEREDLAYAMTNWTSMAAADLVVFNSRFHRDAWFGALPGLLDRMPDHRGHELIEGVRTRSTVLPVGVELGPFETAAPAPTGRPLVVWNQRWDHDKAPGEFVTAVERLAALGYRFDLALLGERPDPPPAELVAVRRSLGDRIVHDGHADLDSYRSILRRADIVVSTAHQEFFGVALTEAVSAGAFPIVPDRVVYPERIPAEHHAACLYATPTDLVDRLRWAIERSEIATRIAADLRLVMAEFDWSVVAERYDEAFTALID